MFFISLLLISAFCAQVSRGNYKLSGARGGQHTWKRIRQSSSSSPLGGDHFWAQLQPKDHDGKPVEDIKKCEGKS